jgi:hypothetical protein
MSGYTCKEIVLSVIPTTPRPARSGNIIDPQEVLIAGCATTPPAFREPAPPLTWNNIIIAGSMHGDEPPFGVAQKGSVMGLDKATGKTLWTTTLAIGDWVTTLSERQQKRQCNAWTGGAVDLDTGVAYIPLGNPSLTSLPTHGHPVRTSIRTASSRLTSPMERSSQFRDSDLVSRYQTLFPGFSHC